MKPTVQQLFDCLTAAAPLSLAMDFDNPGLLVGNPEQQATSALLCLDITGAVIEEAEDRGCNLIVSHHPLFFSLPKALLTGAGGPAGRAVRMLRSDLSAICLHTNMDIATGGVNDLLIQKLQLSPAGRFGRTGEGEETCIGRIGLLGAPLPPADFAARVKRLLGCGVVRYLPGGRPVQRVAVVGGSGGDMAEQALEAGCDTLVTADIKHHVFLEAAEQNLTLIDAGHYHTERFLVEFFEQLIHKSYPDFPVVVSKSIERDIVQTI